VSIGFPLAIAETGLSSAFTAKFQVRFRTRRCDGNSSDSVPLYWLETINLADILPSYLPTGIVGKGLFVCKDDALALMNVGNPTPTNSTALHALAVQIATDFINWRSVSYDITFNGTIASPPNGLTDMMEWTLLAECVSTRQITQPLNGEPEEFNHNDGPNNAGCKDTPGTLYVEKTPCVDVFIPLWQGTISTPSPLGAYRSRVCLEDGRLIEFYETEDSLTCGCGGQTCVTTVRIDLITCYPPDGNGASVVIKDQHGTTIASGTTAGAQNTALFLNFPCDNSATYTVTITKTGFTTITQSLDIVCCQFNYFTFNFNRNPIPQITVNFHVASCGCTEYNTACSQCGTTNSEPGISGVTVGVTVAGTYISCGTNANGDCTITFPVHSNGMCYPVTTLDGPCVLAGPTNCFTNVQVCDNCTTRTYSQCLVVAVDPTCKCFCCETPRPIDLFLTDSVYGDVDLTWGFLPDGSQGYIGTKIVGFAGACGCPAETTQIWYYLQCPCQPPPANVPTDTVYYLFMCYTAYSFLEVCTLIDVLWHSCPGPLDNANKTDYCGSGNMGLNCTSPIGLIEHTPFFGNLLANTTAKCAVPLNILFTYVPPTICTAPAFGGGPCLWHGVQCPTPWPDGATFTVTQ
jgi:hypothetical protein